MDVDELKSKHKELMNKDLADAFVDNPDLVWQTSDLISKLSRRCRKCYGRLMFAIKYKENTETDTWYSNNLCTTCLVLYKVKKEKVSVK
jgi:hypothetical protein